MIRGPLTASAGTLIASAINRDAAPLSHLIRNESIEIHGESDSSGNCTISVPYVNGRVLAINVKDDTGIGTAGTITVAGVWLNNTEINVAAALAINAAAVGTSPTALVTGTVNPYLACPMKIALAGLAANKRFVAVILVSIYQ